MYFTPWTSSSGYSINMQLENICTSEKLKKKFSDMGRKERKKTEK